MFRICRILAVFAVTGIAACGTDAPISGGNSNSPSGLSTLEVAVPAATAEVFGETAKLEMLTHVHFLVQPKDPNCDKASKIDKVAAYTKSSVSDTVYNGCDYYLTLSLGTAVANPADAVAPAPVAPLAEGMVSQDQQKFASQKVKSVYTNFKAVEISRASLENSGGKLTLPITLDLTQFGQENGYTANVKSQD